MKRLISLLSALTLICTMTACSSGSQSSDSSSPDSTAVSISQTAFKETQVALNSYVLIPVKLQLCGDTLHYFYISSDKELHHAVFDGDFKLVSDNVILTYFGISQAVNVNDDGSYFIVEAETDFQFELDEYGNISNYGEFMRKGDVTFELKQFSADDSEVSSVQVVGLERDFNISQSQILNLIPYGDNKLLLNYGNGMAIIGTDGSLVEAERFADQHWDIGCSSDGRVIVSDALHWGYMDGETLRLPDEALADATEILELEGYSVVGNNGFNAYIERNDGIYGITPEGDMTLVFDYNKSLISSSMVTCFVSVNEDRFITVSNDFNGICIYDRRPEDYVESRTTIDLWQIDMGTEGPYISNFNKSHDDYLLNVTTLVRFDDLSKAILTGDGPDVIEFGGYENLKNLVNLGAVADMNELMDTYGGMSRDQILPNVLNAFDIDGHLYTLPQWFNVEMLIANSDVLPKSYSNWSFEDVYDVYDKYCDDMYLFADTAIDMPFTFFCQWNNNMWIDSEKSTCNFDSPEFIELLEFCKKAEDSHFPEPDYSDMDEYNLSMREIDAAIGDKKALLALQRMGGMGFADAIWDAQCHGIDFGHTTMLSFPGNDGHGYIVPNQMLAVMENSDCKEGAWAYILFTMSEEKQLKSSERHQLNYVMKKAFENGYKNIIGTDMYGYTVTQKDVDEYNDFILSCDKLMYSNSAIEQIMHEEFGCYKNDEITAEECAKRIQNRVSIYLSEKS